VLIIGTGHSGLCLAIQLKRAGIETFTLLEKASEIGGTWRDNTYPGACCDVPSMFYCFSFEQRTDWPRKWSPQSEVLAYMNHCADAYGLRPHIRFGQEVEQARFDADAGVWRVRTAAGDTFEAEVLVSGVGQLHKPKIPDIPGLERFAGPRFHSAQWRHDVDLAGKRVAVVGNAASAIQFIPQIAPVAGHTEIFQRSANWMIERGDIEYSDAAKRRFARHPWWARLYRWWIFARAELLLFPVVRGNRVISKRVERAALAYMEKHVRDPEMRRTLTPDYPVCGKRVLISDDYYATLTRDDVSIETATIDRITQEGVVTQDGKLHPADVLVLSTGFDTTHFTSPMKIEGLGGRLLDDAWSDGAEAYYGMTVPGFPNFFMMYGPNTNLGHNSIIFMIECQTRYILECTRQLMSGGSKYIDLRDDVMRAHNRRLQAELAGTVWARTKSSWYKNEAGRITNNWPHTNTRYWWETRHVDWRAFHRVPRDEPSQQARGNAAAA
jgi:cation diffusion facilitator CzcD-associated flavoprotein CzcO